MLSACRDAGAPPRLGEFVSDQLHPLAPRHLPPFITAPGETDVWMVVMGIFLIVVVLAVGNVYLRLHSLPELISSGKLSTAKSFGLHAVNAVGLVHALLLRIQALLLPIKMLV